MGDNPLKVFIKHSTQTSPTLTALYEIGSVALKNC
jgi:hypothetical protein